MTRILSVETETNDIATKILRVFFLSPGRIIREAEMFEVLVKSLVLQEARFSGRQMVAQQLLKRTRPLLILVGEVD